MDARAGAADDQAHAAGDVALAVADAAIAVTHARALTEAMGALAGGTSRAVSWPVGERRTVLASLDRVLDGLSAVRAQVLVAERDSGEWQGRGDRTFEAWRGRTSKVGQRAATVQVRQAEELDTVPGVAAAVTDGLIGLEHAKVIARLAATGTETQRAAATSPEGQQALVDLATRVDAGTFRTSADRWAATVDPTALERDHQAQRADRFFTLTETAHGTHLKGMLDTFTGRKVALALEAATPKPALDDDRTPQQRRADALAELADSVLTDPATRSGAHVPPQVTLILTEDTWLAAVAERDRQRNAAAATASTDEAGDDGPSVATTVVGYEPATWEDGTPVPATELGVAMCECELTRVVIDADGEPLDLGRTQRLFTGVQRRAVIARDRECAWPDCHGPARWAHVHHLDWWDRDHGRTSVTRAVLLCAHHHHEVHRLDLTITRHTIRGTLSGTARPRASMARVWYEFHDPTGRTFGHPPDPEPLLAARRPDIDPTSAADDLDLTRIVNPITGMSQPAFMLT